MARFEILGDVGLGVWHWGLRYRGKLLSVISYGTTCFGGKRGWIAEMARANSVRVLQLCRGGTIPSAPIGVPSRAIAMANKAMREFQGSFVAVAYADEHLGEIGTIYQASGALYTGKTDPKGQANYIMGGKFTSAWEVRRKYGTRDRKRLAAIDSSLEVMPLRSKHRYLFICTPKLVKRRITKAVANYIQPYPTR